MVCGRDAESNRNGPNAPLSHQITEPLRPATIVLSRPARIRTRTARLELACFRYTTGLRERTTRIERASPEWRPGALPAELRPHGARPAGVEPASSAVAGAALFPLSYGRVKEPPAGVEPAPRPYKGRVLAVDTTEARSGDGGVEPAPPRCKRGARPVSYIPMIESDEVRTGGVEPPQPEATGLQPAELTMLSVRRSSAGDRIRTHRLELMRLARTAPPYRARSGWLESNQRSPVPKTGGVAFSPTASRSRARPWRRPEVDDRGIEPRSTAVSERRLPSRPVVDDFEASPGNRTLLAGLTTRGLASSRATQSRREESNPRTSTVGAWCSPTELRRDERPRRESNPPRPADNRVASPDASEGVL